jgi:peptidoglycan hydrolase-like protein with peptidoglycan-binding domain
MSLECLGYDIGPYGIDGKFGNDTENAVCDFQYDHYLEEDGKVGNDTWDAIKDKIIPIQEKLIEKGYDIGPCGADGI